MIQNVKGKVRSTTIICVNPEITLWEASDDFDFDPLVPQETSTLRRTPFVQNKIDECFPPLVSIRI